MAKHVVGKHDRDIAACSKKQTFGYSARQQALIAKKITENFVLSVGSTVAVVCGETKCALSFSPHILLSALLIFIASILQVF